MRGPAPGVPANANFTTSDLHSSITEKASLRTEMGKSNFLVAVAPDAILGRPNRFWCRRSAAYAL